MTEHPKGEGSAPRHTAASAPRAGIPGLTRNIIALGFTSLFTDVSSEMIIPVLPSFVTSTLRASVASLGIIEGVAESTASLLRIASGWLSDRIGRRKPFLLFGYGLSSVAKTSIAIAPTWTAVLGLRFTDRLGKGLRSPPRDALIADSVERRYLGRAFGVHRAMDTAGAVIGPLVAFAMLRAWPGAMRRVFLVSAIPATLSLIVLAVFVTAPRHATHAAGGAQAPRGMRGMGAPFYRFLVVSGVFALASSSVSFLLLLAGRSGIPQGQVPLVYLLYNLIYAALSWPLGELSDRFGRRPLLLAAYLLFAVVYGTLAWRHTVAIVIAAFAVFGIHSALLEGTQRSLLGDLIPHGRRGTGYGLYYSVVGVALLPASALAGALWDRFGTRVAFGLDAALALLAALLFALLLPTAGEKKPDHAHAA